MSAASWPEGVKSGAHVRIAVPSVGLVLEGTVSCIDSDGELFIKAPTERIGVYPQDGMTVVVVPPPLPTAEGVYVDKDGDHWLVDETGKLNYWSRVTGLTDNEFVNAEAADYAPFIKLVPERTPA